MPAIPRPPAPILLMIQGSGCAAGDACRRLGQLFDSSTISCLMPREGRFTVIAVEKPFAGQAARRGRRAPPMAAAPNSTPISPPSAGLPRFRPRLPMRAACLGRSAPHARLRPFGRRGDGRSARGQRSAGDRRRSRSAAPARPSCSISSPFAYQTCFDRTACIADVERQARAIAANPQSATDFAWGHPYRRWTSFFRIDPAAALLPAAPASTSPSAPPIEVCRRCRQN